MKSLSFILIITQIVFLSCGKPKEVIDVTFDPDIIANRDELVLDKYDSTRHLFPKLAKDNNIKKCTVHIRLTIDPNGALIASEISKVDLEAGIHQPLRDQLIREFERSSLKLAKILKFHKYNDDSVNYRFIFPVDYVLTE